MYSYSQSTGKLTRSDGDIIADGYSGSGDGKNNPRMQRLPNVGPIPQGHYVIGDLFDSQTHGPVCLRLCPSVNNQMFGRGGFLIHGDSFRKPGSASMGCIILSHPVRLAIAAGTDRDLTVIA